MSLRSSFALTSVTTLALAIAAQVHAGTVTTDGPDLIIKTKGGLDVSAADKSFGFKVGGRIHADYDNFDGVYTKNGQTADEFYFRRAFLTLSGYAFTDWNYVVSLDFGESGTSRWDELSVTYTGFDLADIKFGRFDPIVGLERATSSNWTTAIERSAIYEIADWAQDKKDGFGLQVSGTSGDLAYASAGIFRQKGNEDEVSGRNKNTFVTRAVVTPINAKGHVLHFGANYATRSIENTPNDTGSLNSRLGVRGTTEDTINGARASLGAGITDGFENDQVWVLEAAYQFGPASIQGEYLQRNLDGSRGQADRDATGYYVQTAYTLTGEARNYRLNGGRFDSIKPSNPSVGAWEVFYRYEDLSVEQTGAADREASIHTLGVNWYANEAIKVALNYLIADTDNIVSATEKAAGRKADGQAISARLQYVF